MSVQLSRREVLQAAGTALVAGLSLRSASLAQPRAKRVVVVGGGIAGLCSAYELMRRGQEVTVLEATGRPGGHVRTISDPFADGLYGDGGAEHFTRPGYDLYREYVREFELEECRCLQRDDVRRLIDGRWYTEEMLQDPAVLRQFGFNGKEVNYLARNPWPEFGMLYYQPYLDSFEDEYQPFGIGLDHLDQISATELLQKDGASEAGIRRLGGSHSALHTLWHAAVLKMRGVPLYPTQVFRLKGGNQKMTDTLAARLGGRVWLGCPVKAIQQGDSGVTVEYQQFGEPKKTEADYVVACVNLSMLQAIALTPALPESRMYPVRYLPYYSNTRIFFQARSRFWEDDRMSPNLSFGHSNLSNLWQMAAEVETDRGFLEGAAPGVVAAEDALSAFRDLYPGRSQNVEQAYVVNWPLEPWAGSCETTLYQPGQLPKIWPHVIQPFGRIHFAGAFADNLNWGMEAATRSAHRVASAIDRL